MVQSNHPSRKNHYIIFALAFLTSVSLGLLVWALTHSSDPVTTWSSCAGTIEASDGIIGGACKPGHNYHAAEVAAGILLVASCLDVYVLLRARGPKKMSLPRLI